MALLSLPFLSLHRPFGSVISASMGSLRVISNASLVFQAECPSGAAYQMAQVALATAALAGTALNFTLGLYLTTVVDLLTNLVTIGKGALAGDQELIKQQCLEAIASSFYLAIMVTGSLEVVLASLIFNGLHSFYQAKGQWDEGHLPECLAKGLMGMIRCYQAGAQGERIAEKRALEKRYAEVAERIKKGREIAHLWNAGFERNNVNLTDCEGNRYNFGSYEHGYGKNLVNGMNINFKEGETGTILEFKIGHHFREPIGREIEMAQQWSKKEIDRLLELSGSHAKGLSIKHNQVDIGGWIIEQDYEVCIEGLGKITICSEEGNLTNIDRIVVKMDEGKNLYEMHEVLSFMGLDDALRSSAEDDVERMKWGQLYRMFYPREATTFEKSSEYVKLSFDHFKASILEQTPEMKGVIESWLPKMELREVLGGKMRYAVDGLADELKEAGALGLTAAVYTGGGWWEADSDEQIKRTVSMLLMGMLSHETRDLSGNPNDGLSGGYDYYTGGADSCFTQMVLDTNDTFGDFAYYTSPVRLLIDPKILEMGSYQYHYDAFGTRETEPSWWFFQSYKDRDNVFEFINEERERFRVDHEVMIKDRIPPEYITGVIVANEQLKVDLQGQLRAHDIKVSCDFIHVGSYSKVTDDMF